MRERERGRGTEAGRERGRMDDGKGIMRVNENDRARKNEGRNVKVMVNSSDERAMRDTEEGDTPREIEGERYCCLATTLCLFFLCFISEP